MPMDEMSFVVTTLERINTKLDKHDDKIDMIATALQQLVKVDTETKELKDSMARAFKRIEIIEHNQNNEGCPAHKAFVRLREEQIDKYENIINTRGKELIEIDKRLTDIEDKPSKAFNIVLKGFLGALGTGVLGWLLWSFDHFIQGKLK